MKTFLWSLAMLAALALGYFGRGRRLSAVADPRMLDLLGQLEPNARALGLKRVAGIFDKLRVHGEHPTLLVGVVWGLPGNLLTVR